MAPTPRSLTCVWLARGFLHVKRSFRRERRDKSAACASLPADYAQKGSGRGKQAKTRAVLLSLRATRAQLARDLEPECPLGPLGGDAHMRTKRQKRPDLYQNPIMRKLRNIHSAKSALSSIAVGTRGFSFLFILLLWRVGLVFLFICT